MRHTERAAIRLLCSVAAVAVVSGPAIAQDPSSTGGSALEKILGTGTGGMPVLGASPPVFASVGDMRFGVRTDGTNPLGRYVAIAGTDRVSFQECGSAETDLIPANLVAETTETCDSLPGRMTPVFTRFAAAEWTYDESRNGYVVTATGPGAAATGGGKFVACSTLPASLLVAAAKAQDGLETVVGPHDVVAGLTVKAGQQKTPVIANSRPSSADCARAPQFWTFDTVSQEIDAETGWTPAIHVPQIAPPPHFIGVATKDPSLTAPSRTPDGGGE